MATHDFHTTFVSLRAMLEPFEPVLVKVHDEPDHYYLDTAHVQKNGKPLFFGAVRVGRRYVSCHLMPVYLWPGLIDGISDALRSRMQGKSCFNFTSADPDLIAELGTLAGRGIDRYHEAGYLPRP
jgi:hypothetical protein